MITKPKLYVWFFWLVDIIALILCWRLLPTVTSQFVLAGALLVIFAFSLADILEPLNIGTFVFAMLLTNYLQVTYHIYPLIISLITGLIVILIGLVSDAELKPNQASMKQIINWFCLAFLVAQSQTILSYWPVSLFSRTLVLMLVFYGLWQLFRFDEETTKLSRALHFAYIGVTAIVIVGTIIWANFPQLIPF